MRQSPVASLLVAALVVLRQPCTRNKATARLLLERAAEHDSLTPAEREACRNLADDLDIDRVDPVPVRVPRTHDKPAAQAILTDWGDARRQGRVATLAFSNPLKGVHA